MIPKGSSFFASPLDASLAAETGATLLQGSGVIPRDMCVLTTALHAAVLDVWEFPSVVFVPHEII